MQQVCRQWQEAEHPNAIDITSARTFLEIVASGSLLRAAERLHVTQTALRKTKVRTLEELLGRRLFLRDKAGRH
jgi:DNA-binding transcriptional LysR family regulator